MAKYNSKFIKKINMFKNKDTEDFVTFPDGKQYMSCMCSSENGFFALKDNEWKRFWTDCKKYFPYHSVFGRSQQTPEFITDAERAHITRYFTKYNFNYDDLFRCRILEIGYGYGGLGLELMEKYNAEYYGIDYVASNKKLLNKCNRLGEKCFLEIDNSGIPQELKNKNFDFIVSFNVFQHLTQKQRFDYIKQAYDSLKNTGYLMFSVFSYNWKCGRNRWDKWQTYFFNVATYIDYDKELQSFLKNTGFKIVKKENVYKINNTTFEKCYLCQK